jgi:hypothetical protein
MSKFTFEDPADTWCIGEGEYYPDSTINVEYTSRHEFVTCGDEILTNKYIVNLTISYEYVSSDTLGYYEDSIDRNDEKYILTIDVLNEEVMVFDVNRTCYMYPNYPDIINFTLNESSGLESYMKELILSNRAGVAHTLCKNEDEKFLKYRIGFAEVG